MNKNQAHRCKGKTKLGKPCRAAATEGGLCYFHANPDKASELGRIGGRSKGPAAASDLDIAALKTADAVLDATARLISDLRAERVRPSIAGAIAPLLNLQLRAIQATNHEARLATIEQKLAETEKKAAESAEIVH